jgi:hypothetical protein
MSTLEPIQTTWNDLSGQVKRHIAPFQQILEEYVRSYGDDDDGAPGNLYDFVRRVLWLAPLAEQLESCTALHHLSPLVHHAVIELRPLPPLPELGVSWTLRAKSEGQYRLQQSTQHGSDWSSTEVIVLVEGDAVQVIRRLTEVAVATCPPERQSL